MDIILFYSNYDKKIFLIIWFLILFIVWYIYTSLFKMEHWYSVYTVPTVRSCQIDADCQWFANSCVNKSFQPKKQEIISSAFPVWEFNDASCFCKDYAIINLCEIK